MLPKRTIRLREASARPAHSGRVERWLGAEKAEHISSSFAGWYGPPVAISGAPGLMIAAGGDFVGGFDRGYFGSFRDNFGDFLKKFMREVGRTRYGYANAGFASISDALSRASNGYTVLLNGGLISKAGATGTAGVTQSLWRASGMPGAGGAAAAAPGGTAFDKSTTGAMSFTNPAAGTLHLQNADILATVTNTLLLHDKLFGVLKTMNSTATEAVTGVPTRYQSSVAANADYAGGNFIVPQVGTTVLAATAHNHQTILYRNQAGTDNVAAPSGFGGRASAAADSVDHVSGTSWFIPLASGDVGAMDLAQIQLNAAVATGVLQYDICHPIAVLAFPFANAFRSFDWLTTSKPLAPRIFDNACLALYELNRPATTATNYQGSLVALNAA